MTWNRTCAEGTCQTQEEMGEWLLSMLDRLSVHQEVLLTYTEFKANFELNFDDFEDFWHSDTIELLRESGLLVL